MEAEKKKRPKLRLEPIIRDLAMRINEEYKAINAFGIGVRAEECATIAAINVLREGEWYGDSSDSGVDG